MRWPSSGRRAPFFVGELGIEPSPALQELHRSILAQDPELETPGDACELRAARRQTTVLLAVFRSRDEPEALSKSVAEASGLLESYDALVEERPGEGLLAVFGLPTTREDDALRSLRASTQLSSSLPATSHVAIESGEILTEGERLVGGHPLTRIGRLS